MKKTTKAFLYTIGLVVVNGLLKFIQYIIDMQYAANIVPGQLEENTSSYKLIHQQQTVNDVFFWAYVAVIVAYVYLLAKMLTKNAPAKTNK